jgi:hypothetical protein
MLPLNRISELRSGVDKRSAVCRDHLLGRKLNGLQNLRRNLIVALVPAKDGQRKSAEELLNVTEMK